MSEKFDFKNMIPPAEHIRSLMKVRDFHHESITAINNNIEKYQLACTHEWEYLTSTPHFELYQCTKCIKTQKI